MLAHEIVRASVNRLTTQRGMASMVQGVDQLCHKERFRTDENGRQVVTEGKAEIVFPSEKDVFYNPVQEFNRDLTIAVVREFSRDLLEKRGVDEPKAGQVHENGLTILEALAASGLRSVRFAREIPGLKNILANDWSSQAVESIQKNVDHNSVQDIVTPSNGDASMVMYQHKTFKNRFDVIDLDPYGSPSPFLDAAVQSVADGGLLCVTATDMAVLCGNAPETCYSKYGAISLKTKCCHELAIRIVLQCLEAHANRYGRYIQPLISLSIDFYVRVFVRLQSGQAACKASTSKLGHVYQCRGCETLAFQRLGRVEPHPNGKPGSKRYTLVSGPPVNQECQQCGHDYFMGGPVWLDPLHDVAFINRLIDGLQAGEYATEERIIGMLTMAAEELQDVPLYYEIPRLTAIVKQSQEKLTHYTSAILNAGYSFSLSHANRHGLKTTAPISFLWDMLRTIGQNDATKKDPLRNLPKGSPGWKIMSQPVSKGGEGISFEPHPLANPASRENNLKRFQLNPEANWGPKARSKTSFIPNTKKEKNQGKHSTDDSPGKPTSNKRPKCDTATASEESSRTVPNQDDKG